MDTTRAQKILGVTLPIAALPLKAAFRRKALTAHPDQGGYHEAFLELTEAYNTIKNSEFCFDVGNREARCEDGTPLRDLGKGFPITEAAVPCNSCQGRGYHMHGKKDCEHCDGQGTFDKRYKPCPACMGISSVTFFGIYCRKCRGRGKVIWQQLHRPITCRFCEGSGSVENYYNRCRDCKGVGETKMWNPVLHRGLLAR